MLKKFIFMFIFLLLTMPYASACESCALVQLGKQGKGLRLESKDHRWFTEYMFEQQIWVERSASEAHTLHHQGHDAHVKTSEDFHHYTLGRHIGERWSIAVELPFIIRRSKEVDSHAHLGSSEESRGVGDMQLLGQYDFFKTERQSAGIFTGIKFPTGSTQEVNSANVQFEPELQPGSGSYDYLGGGVYQAKQGPWEMSFNAVYVAKMPGAAEFEYGDTISSAAGADYAFSFPRQKVTLKAGARLNYQYQTQQKHNGATVEDSGGHVLLGGPQIGLDYSNWAHVYGFYMAPAEQDVGGVHQHVRSIWGGGVKMQW